MASRKLECATSQTNIDAISAAVGGGSGGAASIEYEDTAAETDIIAAVDKLIARFTQLYF